MRRIDEIIIHCSDTQEGCDVTAADIRRWHTTPREKGGAFGWSDIGYHVVIRIDGTIELGRHITRIGAHCAGHNEHSIGVCYVGGRRRRPDGTWKYADTRTPAQRKAMERIIRDTRAAFGPHVQVHGHHEYNPKKACPCFDVQAWLKEVGLENI